MKRPLAIVAAVAALLCLFSQQLLAQPFVRPFPFTLSSRDTTQSPYLPATEAGPAGEHGAWHLTPDGHFAAADGAHMKFFGTELEWSANFLRASDAHVLAKRLRKLGFNAVRLNDYDFFGWDDVSIFQTYDSKGTLSSSYIFNPLHLAQFDTLLYELKQQGIYVFLPLNTYHRFWSADGVPTWDTMTYNAYLMQYLYPEAAAQHHAFTRTLLTHVNPLTGIALGQDPSIACYEALQEQSLSWYWRLDRLHYIDAANAGTQGNQTLSWNQSRRLDTLYAIYLQNKYGAGSAGDARVNAAWQGTSTPDATNRIQNASFETFDNSYWSLIVQPSAKASFSVYPGEDATPAGLIHIPSEDPTALSYGIIFVNTSARIGQDSMYEFSFWSKLRFDPQHPAITSRSIAAVVTNAQTGVASLSAGLTIDTTWKKFTFSFRAATSGLQLAGIVLPGTFGDVFIDNTTLVRIGDAGLRPGESLERATVQRFSADTMKVLSPARARDEAMFYDSLERTYFDGMRRLIHDTLHAAGLFNTSQANYWGSILDYHTFKDGDVTETHAGWDYVSQRPNTAYTDSTWMVRNTPMVTDRGFYPLDIAAAGSITGKANILGTYSVPHPNQFAVEHAVIPVVYASYLDWDGVFFGPYAVRREELFADTLIPGYTDYSWNNISANHAFTALMPFASYAFRNNLIAPSPQRDTVQHDPNDVWLLLHYPDYRGPFGQEQFYYGDQGIFTEDWVRQSYDAPVHQTSAENYYTPGDSLLYSFDRSILWDQSRGEFLVSSPTISCFAGFLHDPIHLDHLVVARTDNAGDMMGVYYLPKSPDSRSGMLAITTRTQNTGMMWVDSLGYGNHYGTAPTIMSAATLVLAFDSQRDSLVLYPLDSTGNRTGIALPGVRDGSGYRVTIDPAVTRSVWYDVEESETTRDVNAGDKDAFRVELQGSPAASTFTALLDLQAPAAVTFEVVDALGRIMLQHAPQMEESGVSRFTIDTRSLPSGNYWLRVSAGIDHAVRNFSVIR